MHLEPGITGSCRTGGRSASGSVPPSGIEPEPLGLQPSAQTNYARVAIRALRAFAARAAQIIIIVLQLSEIGMRRARTSGLVAFALSPRAPRALERSTLTRAHLSRFVIWIRDRESKIQIVVFSDAGPENVEGRLGDPRGGLRTRRVVSTLLVWKASVGTRIEPHLADVAKPTDLEPRGLRGRGGRGFWLIMWS